MNELFHTFLAIAMSGESKNELKKNREFARYVEEHEKLCADYFFSTNQSVQLTMNLAFSEEEKFGFL